MYETFSLRPKTSEKERTNNRINPFVVLRPLQASSKFWTFIMLYCFYLLIFAHVHDDVTKIATIMADAVYGRRRSRSR